MPGMLWILARALRLPFSLASALPYILGAVGAGGGLHLHWMNFALGLVAVLATHLSANMINDYADSKSGLDWRDTRHYGLFGGSKLIQERVLSERFYVNGAVVLALIGATCVATIAVLLSSWIVPGIYFAVLLLAWSYSCRPLRLSYRGFGEPVVFLLFGPVAVAAGYFCQTSAMPPPAILVLSAPMGLLTTSMLVANEVPDVRDDVSAGRRNWVSSAGIEKGYLLYCALVAGAFGAVVLGVGYGWSGSISLLSLAAAFPALAAARVLKVHYSDKARLVFSSRLAIAAHVTVGCALIVDAFL